MSEQPGMDGSSGGHRSTWFKPGVVPLHPLFAGDILGGSLQTLKQYRGPLYGLVYGVAGVAALIVGVAVVVAHSTTGGLLWDLLNGWEYATAGITATERGMLVGALVMLVAVLTVVTVVAATLIQGASVVVTSYAVLGRAVTAPEVWRKTRARFWALLGTGLITGTAVSVPVVLGFQVLTSPIFLGDPDGRSALTQLLAVLVLFACLGVGAYLYVRLHLAAPACVLEDQSPTVALRRSWRLLHRSWWQAFGITALVRMLVMIADQIAQFVVMMVAMVVIVPALTNFESDLGLLVAGMIAVGLPLLAASLVTTPYAYAAATLLYTDRRIRTERFDLQLIALTRPQPPTPQS
ncbi:glycerophosphoryl diester phosphodiesterase membrane domain-containing protein [Streptomyces sp. 549]|uniref:glycerophosphoryl diester phosphodiesterase membrane domain-containing protein n=1 Tax=Streptomyces sp. 549 TaxID=3049076 RepID=UPI0024C2A17B|nr:glycerophosphoryl diester phosphodiesterase membrane domain-containing protein [Streptomyces sp. 549]MDK1472874.1 glycerophosphoryl diester phosphodiesterase membrane domain-containing protein [Streptomyces sp. 549]